MLQALLTWSERAAVSHPETVQELLHSCLDLSTDSSPQVRAAFAQDAHAFAQPVLLKAVYAQGVSGTTEQVDIASCEAKLLQVSMLCLAMAPMHLPSHVDRTQPQTVLFRTSLSLAICMQY